MFEYFMQLDKQLQVELIKLLFTLFIGLFPILLYLLNKRKELKLRTSDERKKSYENYLTFISNLLAKLDFNKINGTEDNVTTEEKQLCLDAIKQAINELYENNYKLSLCVSKKLSKKISRLTNCIVNICASNLSNNDETKILNTVLLVLISEVIILMRKEVGLSSDNLSMVNFIGINIAKSRFVYDDTVLMSHLKIKNPFLYNIKINKKIRLTLKEHDKTTKNLKKRMRELDRKIKSMEHTRSSVF